ncbi:hypothetical protein [Halopseudomonas sp.]|uniref:hypothetical protein n=1 Tax=Halopseudomonas sp. TaxID=2901191 RepID=UPI003567E7BA
MMLEGFHGLDDDADEFDPLNHGAVPPPPVIGGGCLARFDPLALNEDSGADFAPEPDTD